jgi:hypothetical protein
MGADIKRHGWARVAGVAAVGAALVATGITAVAGGQPNYLGILKGANPTGYTVSPNSYDISGGPVTVTINQNVWSLTSTDETVTLNMRVHHILTENGVNISDGQPGQTGITWTRALVKLSTQTLVGTTANQTVTVAAGLTPTVMTWTWTFTTCGYFQFDIANSPPPILGSGFIRVLGCGQQLAPRLTPGFWKNHEAATTAELPQLLGSFSVNDFATAVAIFDAMKCSSPIDCLAGHLLAAELDVQSGSATCISPTIADANLLLSNLGYGGPGIYTAPSSAQKTQALADEVLLDAYTNDSTSSTC